MRRYPDEGYAVETNIPSLIEYTEIERVKAVQWKLIFHLRLNMLLCRRWLLRSYHPQRLVRLSLIFFCLLAWCRNNEGLFTVRLTLFLFALIISKTIVLAFSLFPFSFNTSLLRVS